MGTFTQTCADYRWRLDTSGEDWAQALHTSDSFGTSVIRRLRVAIAISGANGTDGFKYQYQNVTQATGWQDITTSSAHVRAVDSSYVTDNASTTQLISAGSFVDPNYGFTEDGVVSSCSMTKNYTTEHELVIQLQSGDVANSDVIQIRPVLDDGTLLNGGYSYTPELTVTVGVVEQLAGTSAAVSGASAALSITRKFAGTAAATAVGTVAAISLTLGLVGSSDGVSGATAPLGRVRAVAGSSDGASGASGTLAVGPDFEFISWRWRNDDGNEAAASWREAAATNAYCRSGYNVRLRLAVRENSGVGANNRGVRLKYRYNEGSWLYVSSSSSYIKTINSSYLTDGEDCTQQISSGSYLSTNTGVDESQGYAGIDDDWSGSEVCEYEFSLYLYGCSLWDTVDIQPYLVDDGLAEKDLTLTAANPRLICGPKLDQDTWRWRNDNGSESAATWKDAAETNITENDWSGNNLRLRFRVPEIGNGGGDIGLQLQCRMNGGSWWNVTASSDYINAAASGYLTDGQDTTEQLGSGNFISTNAGVDEADGKTAASATYTGLDDVCEYEYCVNCDSTDISGLIYAEFEFRVVVATSDEPLYSYSSGYPKFCHAPKFEIDHYRGRNDDGNEAGATWKAGTNTDWTQTSGQNFRVRFNVGEKSGVGIPYGTPLRVWASYNSGSWFQVTDSTSIIKGTLSGYYSDLDDTTQQIGSGSYLSTNMWLIEGDPAAESASYPQFAGGDFCEFEACLQIVTADVSDNDEIELRLQWNTGGQEQLNAYNYLPTITVQKPQVEQLAGTAAAVSGASAPIRVTRKLAGTAAAVSGASATLSKTGSLAGSSDATSGATAPIDVTRKLVGSSDAASGATAALGRVRPVAGSSDATSGASAALDRIRDLAGSADGATGASATLNATIALAGSADAVSGAAAAIDVLRDLAGTSAGQGGATAPIDVTRKLAGSSDAASGAAAALVKYRSLAGSSDAQSGASGTLSVGAIEALAGSADAVSGASAALERIRGLVGSADAVSTAGAPIGVVRELAGTSAAQSGATGDLSIQGVQELAGSSDAVSGATGAIDVTRELAGSADAQSGASASLGRVRPVAGSSDATSGASAALSVTRGIAGSADAVSGATAPIDVVRGLVGSADAQSGATAPIELTRGLVGSADAASTAGAALSTTRELAGSADAAAGASASMTKLRSLAGSSAAASGASAAMSPVRGLAGSSDAVSTATAPIALTIGLAGTAAGAAGATADLTVIIGATLLEGSSAAVSGASASIDVYTLDGPTPVEGTVYVSLSEAAAVYVQTAEIATVYVCTAVSDEVKV